MFLRPVNNHREAPDPNPVLQRGLRLTKPGRASEKRQQTNVYGEHTSFSSAPLISLILNL